LSPVSGDAILSPYSKACSQHNPLYPKFSRPYYPHNFYSLFFITRFLTACLPYQKKMFVSPFWGEEGAKADPGKPGITENEFKEKGGQVIPGVPGNKGGQPIIAAQQQKEPPVILLAKAV
jgi:hypothetical protein